MIALALVVLILNFDPGANGVFAQTGDPAADTSKPSHHAVRKGSRKYFNNLFVARLEARDLPGSIKVCTNALRKFPKDSTFYANRGAAFLASFLISAPNSTDAHRRQILLKALNDFDSALALPHASNGIIYYDKSICLSHLGRSAEALETAKKLTDKVDRERSMVDVYFVSGDYKSLFANRAAIEGFLDLEHYDENDKLIDYCTAAIKKYPPQDAVFYASRARGYMNSVYGAFVDETYVVAGSDNSYVHMLECAVADLQKGRQMDKEGIYKWEVHLVECLQHLGRFQEARALIASIKSKSDRIHYLALAEYLEGDDEKVVGYYQKYGLVLRPETLAYSYSEVIMQAISIPDYKKARRLILEAKRAAPNSCLVYEIDGELEQLLHNNAACKLALTKCMKLMNVSFARFDHSQTAFVAKDKKAPQPFVFAQHPSDIPLLAHSEFVKSFTPAEENHLRVLFNIVEYRLPGLLQRISAKSPIVLIRGQSEYRPDRLPAEATAGPHYVMFNDSFFTVDQNGSLEALIHELVHESDFYGCVSNSKIWLDYYLPLVTPSAHGAAAIQGYYAVGPNAAREYLAEAVACRLLNGQDADFVKSGGKKATLIPEECLQRLITPIPSDVEVAEQCLKLHEFEVRGAKFSYLHASDIVKEHDDFLQVLGEVCPWEGSGVTAERYCDWCLSQFTQKRVPPINQFYKMLAFRAAEIKLANQKFVEADQVLRKLSHDLKLWNEKDSDLQRIKEQQKTILKTAWLLGSPLPMAMKSDGTD